jgi:hypothetical protein
MRTGRPGKRRDGYGYKMIAPLAAAKALLTKGRRGNNL